MISNEKLEEQLIQLRKIVEHRESKAAEKIEQLFKELFKTLKTTVSEEYLAFEEDPFKLLTDARYAGFLENALYRDGLQSIGKVEDEVLNLVEGVYEYVYNATVDIFTNAGAGLKSMPLVTKQVLRAAVENPIYGLTLSETLERYRLNVVYDIKKHITIGLMNRDRYSTMARRIADVLEDNYVKAMRIVRTEVHRVTEAGSYAAAKEVNAALEENSSGYKLVKKWITMEDERVRKTKKANHVKMNNVTVGIDEYFDLGKGIKAMQPGSSGDAANDINCRCMAVYQLV